MPIDPAALKAAIEAEPSLAEHVRGGNDTAIAAWFNAESPDPAHVAMKQRVTKEDAAEALGVSLAARTLARMATFVASDATGETALVLDLFNTTGVNLAHRDSAAVMTRLAQAGVFGNDARETAATIAALRAVGVRRLSRAEAAFGVRAMERDVEAALRP
jgi:hypothetical protein